MHLRVTVVTSNSVRLCGLSMGVPGLKTFCQAGTALLQDRMSRSDCLMYLKKAVLPGSIPGYVHGLQHTGPRDGMHGHACR